MSRKKDKKKGGNTDKINFNLIILGTVAVIGVVGLIYVLTNKSSSGGGGGGGGGESGKGSGSGKIVYINKKRGINNPGNNCYLNSTLQLLFHIPELSESIIQMTKNNETTKFIKRLLKIYQSDDTDNISADIMRQFLNEIISQEIFFPRNTEGQQDANDFMIKLFGEIEKNNNIIDEIFKFNIKSINECKYKTNPITNNTSFEGRTPILQLAITEYIINNPSENLSISNLLNYDQRIENIQGYTCGVINPDTKDVYTEEEWNSDIVIKIGEENYTNEDRKSIESTKQQKIENFSDYLLIQLKIFNYVDTSSKQIKLTDNINIDNEINIDENRFKIIGIIFHSGTTTESGHYWTIMKDWDNQFIDTWTRYNDGIVTDVKDMDAILKNGKDSSGDAYMLLYKKID